MREYEKPAVETLNEKAEGVFAASGAGDEEERRCRFGFTNANPGRDQCQFCSASGGTTNKEGAEGEQFIKDYTGCPDDMPEK